MDIEREKDNKFQMQGKIVILKLVIQVKQIHFQYLIIYISHMKRKGGVERIFDDNHTQLFSLSSLTAGSKQKFNFSFEINVKTMKGKLTDINEGHRPENMLNLPRLNKDKNPLSPTFVFDQTESVKGVNDIKVAKAMRYAEETDDTLQQILIPKPSSHYCHVCKATYTDYLNHINQQFHKRKINQADKEYKVGDLISMFEKSKERQRKRGTGEGDESCVEKRKRKIRIIDDPSCFSPIPISLSKSISESTYNSTFFPKTSQRILI